MTRIRWRLMPLFLVPVALACGVKTVAEHAERRAVERAIVPLTAPCFPNAGATPTELAVEIEPRQTLLRPTLSPGYDGKMRRVLVLPLQITNRSSQTLRADLAHEWFGGLWPPTDLYVYQPAIFDALVPVFLEGETGKANPLVWRAGETKGQVKNKL